MQINHPFFDAYIQSAKIRNYRRSLHASFASHFGYQSKGADFEFQPASLALKIFHNSSMTPGHEQQ
jgi:hypothetical protein